MNRTKSALIEVTSRVNALTAIATLPSLFQLLDGIKSLDIIKFPPCSTIDDHSSWIAVSFLFFEDYQRECK
jgi:hypothetical protein